MTHFEQKVKRSSRKDMISFLSEHFRYFSMSSWNKVTSYANNVKIHNLPLTSEQKNKAYDLIVSYFYDNINDRLEDFGSENNYYWQAGFNGRSGGYIVLVNGGRRLSEHKSYCTDCGQRNFTAVEENNNICGRCGKPKRVNHTFYEVYTQPGKGVDMNEDFSDWTMADLKDRVDTVCQFDRMCDKCLSELIYTVEHFEVEEEEEEVFIPKTVKVMREKSTGTNSLGASI